MSHQTKQEQTPTQPSEETQKELNIDMSKYKKRAIDNDVNAQAANKPTAGVIK